MLRHSQIVFFVAASLLLAGCTDILMPPAVTDFVSMKWFIGPAPTMAPADARYCYGTIGDPDCYREPLADGGNRLVGYVGPPPPGYLP
ncbi:MAG: hypothetical protein ACTSX7_04065 [Alphaproteobacteria bacterium]